MHSSLVTPFSMLVAASSNSGKTQLVRDLLLSHYMMFDHPIHEVVWCYHKNAYDKKLFDGLAAQLNVPITFIEGFPAIDIESGNLFKTSKDQLKCLVLDDIVPSALKSSLFLDLFTVLSHHQSLVVIAILQNLHANTSSQRQLMNNIIRNVSYLVLFPDRRQMNACKQVARTYFNGEEYRVVEPFKHLIENNKKFHYMVVDFVDPIAPVKFNSLREDGEKYIFTFE